MIQQLTSNMSPAQLLIFGLILIIAIGLSFAVMPSADGDPSGHDPYFGDPPEPSDPPAPTVDLDSLTDEQQRQIALKYGLRTGEFIPREMLPQNQQPAPPAPTPPARTEWDPIDDNEDVPSYVRRQMTRELQSIREEVRKEVLEEARSQFGVGATYAAAESVIGTVERAANIPEEAKPYLRRMVPDLLAKNPELAGKLDETSVRQLAALAIGQAAMEGKYQPAAPVTQRDDLIPVPQGANLAPGVSQTDFELSVQMWQELRGFPLDEKGNRIRPSVSELRSLGVLR